jgi:uncharacterized membrane-anchored protein
MIFLIELLVVLLVLFVVGGAALYIIRKFALPQEAQWIVGAILLIGLLLYTAYAVQGGGPLFVRR